MDYQEGAIFNCLTAKRAAQQRADAACAAARNEEPSHPSRKLTQEEKDKQAVQKRRKKDQARRNRDKANAAKDKAANEKAAKDNTHSMIAFSIWRHACAYLIKLALYELNWFFVY